MMKIQPLKYRTAAVCMALAIGLSANAQESDAAPWADWRKAIQMTMDAKSFRDRGNWQEAIRLYNSARDTFEQIKLARPTWNMDILDQRIAECEGAVLQLNQRLPQTPAVSVPSKDAAPYQTAAPSGETLALRQDLADYKDKLFRAQTELDELRRDLRNSQANALTIESLQQEKRLLQEQYTMLQNQYQTLRGQVEQPDQEKDKLKNQLVEVQLNYDLVSRREELLKNKLDEMNTELAGVYAARNQSQAESKASRDRVLQLEREIAQLNSRTQTRDDAVLKAESQLQTLTAERDDLRKQLAAKQTDYDQLFQRFSSTAGADQTAALLAADLQTVQKRHDELQRDYATLNTDYRQAREQNREIQLNLTRQGDTLQRVSEKHKLLELDYNALNERFAEQGKALEMSSASEKEAVARASILDAEAKQLRKAAAELEARKTAWEATAQQNTDARNTELENLRKLLDDAQKRFTEQDAQNTALKNRLQEAETHANSMRQEFIDLKAKSASLELGAKRLDELKLRCDELEQEAEAKLALQQQLDALKLELETLKKAPPAIIGQPAVDVKTTAATPSVKLPQPLARELTAEEIAVGLQGAAEALANQTPDLALWEYQRILKSAPDNLEANRGIGKIYLAQDRHLEAAKYLKKVYDQRSDDLEVVAEWSEVLTGSGQPEAAWTVLDKGLQSAPDNCRLLLAASRTLSALNRLPEAETALRHAFEQQKPTPELQLELTRLLLKADRDRDAAQAYEAARAAGAGPDAAIEAELGVLLPANRELCAFLTQGASEALKAQDWDLAVWYYNQLTALEPESATWWNQLAYMQLRRNNAAAAVEALNQSGKLHTSADAEQESLRLALMAAACLAQHQVEDAAKRYQALLDLHEQKAWLLPGEFAGIYPLTEELFAQAKKSPDLAQAQIAQTQELFAQAIQK